jgi:hypothetical protein
MANKTTLLRPARENVFKLAGRAAVDIRTAERFLLGCPDGRPSGALRDRCVEACTQLKIPVPSLPEQTVPRSLRKGK